jgi:DnaJ-class molecular chaperone
MADCNRCRGTGKNYHTQGLLPVDCTSCNGTGINGNPFWIPFVMLATGVLFAWVLYRIYTGVYP